MASGPFYLTSPLRSTQLENQAKLVRVQDAFVSKAVSSTLVAAPRRKYALTKTIAFGCAASLATRSVRSHVLRRRTRRKEPRAALVASAASQEVPVGSKFEVCSIPGKGLGIVATTPIIKGERILTEVPLIRLPSDIEELTPDDWEQRLLQLVDNCSPEEQKQLWALEDVNQEEEDEEEDGIPKSVTGIVLTNAYADTTMSKDEVIKEGGLFALISRFNSSCCPNLTTYWNADKGVRFVHALRNVEVGEELCVCYVDLLKTRSDRRFELKSRYDFKCQCEACNGNRRPQNEEDEAAAVASSDQRRIALEDIDRVLPLMMGMEDLGEDTMNTMLELVGKADELLEEELDGHAQLRCRFYNDAFQLAVAGDQVELAKELARRAYESAVIATGDDDSAQAATLKRYADDPLELARDLAGNSSD